jgi:hypothetical protein
MGNQTLIVDETGVVRRWSGGREAVRWEALARVEIVTTDDGPFAEDFFWILADRDGLSGVCIGGADAESVQLLRVLGDRLPGLDHEAVVLACGSCTPARFVVWSDSRVLTQSNETKPAMAAAARQVVDARADANETAGWWSRLLAWWS